MDEQKRPDWDWLKENGILHGFFHSSPFLLLQNQTSIIHWKGLTRLFTLQPTLPESNVHSEWDQVEGKDNLTGCCSEALDASFSAAVFPYNGDQVSCCSIGRISNWAWGKGGRQAVRRLEKEREETVEEGTSLLTHGWGGLWSYFPVQTSLGMERSPLQLPGSEER